MSKDTSPTVRKPKTRPRQPASKCAESMVTAARKLRRATGRLKFGPPVSHVYRPLDYAWAAHEQYLRRYARSAKRVVFLGMNPGPFGMVQTGIPFGEVNAVRDWLQIDAPVKTPSGQHPKRPVQGFKCERSEVSGRRLWGLFAHRYLHAKSFFEEHFVVNYCPLAFVEESGRNRTPDKLPVEELKRLTQACDEHLLEVMDQLKPKWLIGIGAFAEKRARILFSEQKRMRIGLLLHPSPANPAANRGWETAATEALFELGIWSGAGIGHFSNG